MAIKTKPFDAAKYFTTPEAQQRLLNDALGDGDAGYIAAVLGTIAKARGMTDVAKETGLNRASLYAALQETGNPSLVTFVKVLDSLGLRLVAEAKTPEHV